MRQQYRNAIPFYHDKQREIHGIDARVEYSRHLEVRVFLISPFMLDFWSFDRVLNVKT